MKKKFPKEIILLFAFCLAFLSLSKANSDFLREKVVAVLAPAWSVFQAPTDELKRLKIENERLKDQVKQLSLQKSETEIPGNCEVIGARVICRPTSTFDTFLWVNVGRNINEQLGKEILMKNSPVVVENALVGVVDYVGKKQSRIRLITDKELNPAVRVFREVEKKPYYLAKGELRGAIGLPKRSQECILKGVGFNCDYADPISPARELKSRNLPIVQIGDLIITSGLDGVFPAGLKVGKVSKIVPLKEGDYYYDIEIKPQATTIAELSQVFILSPLGFDPEDKPLRWN